MYVIFYMIFFQGHGGQMGAVVKQPGSRVSKIEVSTKQFLLFGVEFWFHKHGGLVPVR